MGSPKDKYRELCRQEKSIPLFSKDWWLDAVCGEDHWDVVLAEKGDEIVASLPFSTSTVFGLKLLSKPKLTPYLGVWIRYPDDQKYATKMSHEKAVFTELIEQLPAYDYFYQNFHHTVTNWLPFYWKGFEQTTKYTQIIEDIGDTQKLYKDFNGNIRREIQKAEKALTVHTADDIGDVYAVISMIYDKQKIKTPFSPELLGKIDGACRERDCRRAFVAKGPDGATHAVLYIVWDDMYAYYLAAGSVPEHRNSGAASLLTWEAIRFASTVTRQFDFEGSIIEPIERFFRGFGAVQRPFFVISKANTLRMKFLRLFVNEEAGTRIMRWVRR